MRRHSPIRAVLLDVGGTLVKTRGSVAEIYARVFTTLGEPTDPTRVAPLFASAWQRMAGRHGAGCDRYRCHAGGERGWWRELLGSVLVGLSSRLDTDAALDALYRAFADAASWRVFEEVPEVIEELRRRGLRLAAVSNWDSRLPALLDATGLAGSLDAIVVSALEGVEKPDPEIFGRALARLGVEAAASLHVGDTPADDVRGAEAAGVKAVLIDRTACRNDAVAIRDLRGLYAILR